MFAAHRALVWFSFLILAPVQLTLATGQEALAQIGGSSSSPITLHLRFGACELVQNGKLLSEDQYASVRLDGVPEPIFSPELGSDDFVGYSPGTPPQLTKLARKSGFRLKSASDGAVGELPKIVTSGKTSNCPSLQEALQRAERDRIDRRRALQSKVFQAGLEGVSPPEAAATPQLKSESQNAGSLSQPAQTPAKGKGKPQGTVIMSCIVTSNGDVERVRVIRSLSADIDKRAAEAAARWKFHPAKKYGLPVPVEIQVEISISN